MIESVDEDKGLRFFHATEVRVDGIDGSHPEHGGNGPGYVRSLVSLAEDHDCAGTPSCDWDELSDFREGDGPLSLPTEDAVACCFRWRPGDPIFPESLRVAQRAAVAR